MFRSFMNHSMASYSWETAFDHLKEQGVARIGQLFKIAFPELTRLEKEFSSLVPGQRKTARYETLALFHRINVEMKEVKQVSGLSDDEFTQQIKEKSNFTPQEWAQLSHIPQLLNQHYEEFLSKMAFRTPKKRNPYFKV